MAGRIPSSVFFLLIAIFVSVAGGADSVLAQTQGNPRVVSIYVAESINDAEWNGLLVRHSQAAADALDMELEQIFAGTERPVVLKTLRRRLSESPKPDFVIFANQRGLGVDMLNICEEFGVNAFLYVAPLLPEEYDNVGRPRENLKHWIGELIPDDEKAGYDQAQTLIQKARERKKDGGDIRMLAITGLRSTTSAVQRQRGLTRALSEHDDVELLQLVAARWLASVAQKKYELLVGRYGAVDAVWVANDPMALGVLNASVDDVSPPFVGGVDWITSAVEAIKDERLVVSMGGHIIDIAYVMALLRNHYDGVDFAEIAKSTSLSSYLVPLSPENVGEYDEFFEQLKKGKVDFRAGLSGLHDGDAFADLSMQRFMMRSTTGAKR